MVDKNDVGGGLLRSSSAPASQCGTAADVRLRRRERGAAVGWSVELAGCLQGLPQLAQMTLANGVERILKEPRFPAVTNGSYPADL